MEELIEIKIAQYITGVIMSVEQKEWHYKDWEDALPMAKEVLTLIREAGYRSPKEVESLVFQGILYADKGQVEEIKRRG